MSRRRVDPQILDGQREGCRGGWGRDGRMGQLGSGESHTSSEVLGGRRGFSGGQAAPPGCIETLVPTGSLGRKQFHS